MKYLAILGSTGSIGQNALEVVRHFPRDFKVLSLSANSNIRLLYRQMKEFKPEFVSVQEEAAARLLQEKAGSSFKVFSGEKAIANILTDRRIDKVVMGISGSAALAPLLKAIDLGKEIALANKEALVMAGQIMIKRAKEKKAKLIPVDSEQSAIWQCIEGRSNNRIKNIYLTASGGPFWNASQNRLKKASVRQVLQHPRWKMGRKITVDSASLMNKGLEVLEAMYLFGVNPENIKVLIHPEAIIHSMVEFDDGVVIAQLSATDMRIPIQYALTYPKRVSNSLPRLDFYKMRSLSFDKPDFKKFPCLKLAYQAADEQGVAPCVLNAANEVCVEAFLGGRLDFISIPKLISQVLSAHAKISHPSLKDILEADSRARHKTSQLVERMN